MGASGSGKSTVLRLLTGAFKNFEGSVLINDIPIGNYNISSLRSATGILLSQQDIFQGTLWENITMGNKEIQLSTLTEMIELCGLTSFMELLPEGLDSQLDPAGKKLPKKIRQGILLARALIGHRKLVLLEEPFNGIELDKQKKILEFLQRDEYATVILTSSNLDIAKQCDQILYLNKGLVEAYGDAKTVSNQIKI
jgi:ATP-binding cassette, subfamily B, bacterial